MSAKHGKPYISPIVPEDLSILTEGETYEVLVHAGTQLPVTLFFAGRRQFYLTEDGQQEITIPIYIGHDNPRRRASTLTIPIKHRHLKQGHPVEVELTIDKNKISLWRFRPVGFDWCEPNDVANPWIGQEPSEAVEKLQTHREAIRTTLEKGLKPKAGVLLDEAISAAKAGFQEAGLRLVEDVLEEYPDHAGGWNIKGLIHGLREEPESEAACYRKATELDPDKQVYRGNYGVALHQIEKHTEAIEVMREALSRDQTLTYLHSWLAEAFKSLNNPDEMRKELERWHLHARQETVRRPYVAEAWEELVVTAVRLGKYDEAEEAREQIRELNRDRNLLARPGHG